MDIVSSLSHPAVNWRRGLAFTNTRLEKQLSKWVLLLSFLAVLVGYFFQDFPLSSSFNTCLVNTGSLTAGPIPA